MLRTDKTNDKSWLTDTIATVAIHLQQARQRPFRQRSTPQWFILGPVGLVITILSSFLISFALSPVRLHSQACPPQKILFIGSSAPLAARDEPLRVYLSALGHEVTVRSAAAVQAADAKGQDLIIISESAESVDVNTKLREVAVPIVTWEGWLQDDFAMTGPSINIDYGENLRQQTIRITNPSHPLAAGLSGIVETVTNKKNKFHWGIPNANAVVVAVDVDNDQHPMIYSYEQGVQMEGMAAPARRIFIHNATGPNLTVAGWQLFEATVTWAAGCASPPAPSTKTPTPTNTPTATAAVSATPSTTPTTTATPTALAKLTVKKQDLLFIDADEDAVVSNGDTLLYSITIYNAGDNRVNGITLEDTPDENTKLIAGTVRSDQGAVAVGNQPTDQYVIVTVGDLGRDQTARILFQVQIHAGEHQRRWLRNQAQVRYISNDPTGQGQQFSDDPDTPEENDETITPLGNPATQPSQPIFLPLISQ